MDDRGEREDVHEFDVTSLSSFDFLSDVIVAQQAVAVAAANSHISRLSHAHDDQDDDDDTNQDDVDEDGNGSYLDDDDDDDDDASKIVEEASDENEELSNDAELSRSTSSSNSGLYFVNSNNTLKISELASTPASSNNNNNNVYGELFSVSSSSSSSATSSPQLGSSASQRSVEQRSSSAASSANTATTGASATAHTSSSCCSQPRTKNFVFRDDRNASRLLERLNEQRSSSRALCDVTLRVKDADTGAHLPCELHAHKCVLAALSPYFQAMFGLELAESRQSCVAISQLDAATLGAIVDYAYTSTLDINAANVQSLLAAANLLDIKPLAHACARYMTWNLDACNCIGVYLFAEAHDCGGELRRDAHAYVLDNFARVSTLSDEFVALDVQQLVELVADDALGVRNEEIVFDACMRWLDHAVEERSAIFHQVMCHIRLPMLSPYFLYDRVIRAVESSERLLKECRTCQALIHEAIMHHMLATRRGQEQNERTRYRNKYECIEALVLIGGEDECVILRSNEAYLPSANRWMRLQCSPYALSKHGITTGGDGTSLYLAGGETPNGNANNTCWLYNSIADDWRELASLHVPRADLGLVTLDTHVYAVGGSNHGELLASVERYDPITNKWKYCCAMASPLSSPAVCSLGGCLYVAGGDRSGEGDASDTFSVYRPSTNAWAELTRMPAPKFGAGACALNACIYIIGGHALAELDTVEMYDTRVAKSGGDEWRMCPSMNKKRYKPGIASLNTTIYACGGRTSASTHLDSVEAFCTVNQQWSILTTMSCGRSWLACAALKLANPLIKERRVKQTNN